MILKEFFYTGLMGSGKSESLISMVESEKKDYMVLNAVFEGITGSIGVVTSRNGKSVQSIQILSEADTKDIERLLTVLIEQYSIKILFIDEIQFLEPLQLVFIREFLAAKDVKVIYFGLETDFTGALFKATSYLKERLSNENIFYIKRKCEMCGSEAEYNARIVNGEVVHSGELFAEQKALYKALCSTHYYEK